ncbi:MAG: LysM peptidoglycan-binding domain-containing protein [Gammaproteobacteria bacterium]|nr:MAG: LysM peptidoglycan-binding domain-containing protein [Gammaproteobacteria bacterium]
MRKVLSIVSLAVGLMLAQWSWAEAQWRNDYPETYTVVKGDTLWDISSRFLNNPWYWPEIWYANPQIANPHLIYPGDVLTLVYIDGKRRVTVGKRSEAAGTLKLSPKVRATPLASAIPSIPLDAIAPFLTTTRIVTREELDKAPYVLQGKRGNLVVGAGDSVYVRGETKPEEAYGVYREATTYVDPDTNEFLGLEARAIAHGKITEARGEIGTYLVQKSSAEILAGDRLLHEEDRELATNFVPSVPDTDVEGKMIAVLDGVSQVGQYDVVVVNLGADKVKQGNVLAVYKKGEQVKDPYTKDILQLPSERAGIMMIFRVFDKVSYGLILRAERPLAILDEVRKP